MVTHPSEPLLMMLHHAVVTCFQRLHALRVLEQSAISAHRELRLVLAEVVVAE